MHVALTPTPRVARLVAFSCWLAGIVVTAFANTNYESPYTFTTVAGLSPAAAKAAEDAPDQFKTPGGVAVDGAGAVYLSNSEGNTVCRITTNGNATVLAGNWVTGATDGSGTSARFHWPAGIAAEPDGTLWVADSYNHVVRKITPGGVVTTFAGTAGQHGATDGVGAEARFSSPRAIAMDRAGNLFVAESAGRTIRKISRAGAVTTLAGTADEAFPDSVDGTGTSARFWGPSAVAVDGSGNLFVVDGSAVRKITPAGVVSTLAGQARKPGAIDGTGSAARFYWPTGVAVDATGTLFVADTGSHTIRKITAGGVVSTVAGLVGDKRCVDGIGTDARFNSPAAVAIDGSGNLWVADQYTLRKITSGGLVTRIAGRTPSFGGDDGIGRDARFANPYGAALDAAGNVYITSGWTVRKLSRAGVVTTLAGQFLKSGWADSTGRNAGFTRPDGLAVDAHGNVVVADGGTTIRRVSPEGVVTTTVGMTFSSPQGLALDASGTLFIADAGNQTIRKITPAGVATLVAGTPGAPGSRDGSAEQAQFCYPSDVAVDAVGNLYVADAGNAVVRKIGRGGEVTTLAGVAGQTGNADGPGSTARFTEPTGVTVDRSGNVYVADRGGSAVRKINASGVVSTVNGRVTAGDLYAWIAKPNDVAVDASGNLYVANSEYPTIVRVTPDGLQTTFAGNWRVRQIRDGTGSDASFVDPLWLALAADGALYVSDWRAVRKVTDKGTSTYVDSSGGNWGGSADAASLDEPAGVAMDSNGVLYVADPKNHRIRRIGSGNMASWYPATAFGYAAWTAVDSAGNMYVSDSGEHVIRRISPTGANTVFAGTSGAAGSADGAGGTARFDTPQGVAVDGTGNVFVADFGNSTIRRISRSGVVTTLAGAPGVKGSDDGAGAQARFSSPRGIAVAPSGNVFVSDDNATIRRITPTGVVTTIAGAPDVMGDADGVGPGVRFWNPAGIAVDQAENIYVADSNNHTIRKGAPPAVAKPRIITQPQSGVYTPGAAATLSCGVSQPDSTIVWSYNGHELAGVIGASLPMKAAAPMDTGVYWATATNALGSVTTDPAVVGLAIGQKSAGEGHEILTNVVHPNGNRYDQISLDGAAAAVRAEYSEDGTKTRATRISFIDLDDDIVQVEFSGHGTLSLVLEDAKGPALPVHYAQDYRYMKGHAGIVIAGADETTNLTIFAVGRATANDPTGQFRLKDPVSAENDPAKNGSPLFVGHPALEYDGIADIAFVAILSANGKFGGVRTANVNYFAQRGLTGIYAPGVTFTGPLYIGNITAFGDATPVIRVGAVSDARITGGDLAQANDAAVRVFGLTKLKFTPGLDAHGRAVPAQRNAAVLEENEADVTGRIVVNP